MSEGLADYGGDIGSPDDRFGWETWFKVTRDDGAPAEIEGNVAAALWDLIDENNEGDDDTHDDHFPGISAPPSVRVTRPSNWDKDDIRSTWLKSMGNN